ncbi:MAG: hypothetical protein IPP48_01980 [Chitinophagaceae bacterium]|nr:hypothetical protein [Chitinophagaceae bacterium]
MKKISVVFLMTVCFFSTANAQIDLNKIINVDQLLGKVLNVQKGFAPKFSLGNTPFSKISKVAEIIGLKKNDKANKLFNTFKTGRTVYRVAQYAAGAVALYSSIKAIDKSAIKSDYQKPLIAAVSTAASGLLVKFLTKAASYKAVDVFNGVVKDKIKDIFSIAPASQTMGVGLYVKL